MTTTTLTAADLIAAIHRGEFDENLAEIGEAARERARYAARLRAATLKPGDKAVVTDSISPKYLAGATVTVVRQSGAKVVCTLDDDYGRFPAGRELKFPAVCLKAA